MVNSFAYCLHITKTDKTVKQNKHLYLGGGCLILALKNLISDSFCLALKPKINSSSTDFLCFYHHIVLLHQNHCGGCHNLGCYRTFQCSPYCWSLSHEPWEDKISDIFNVGNLSMISDMKKKTLKSRKGNCSISRSRGKKLGFVHF